MRPPGWRRLFRLDGDEARVERDVDEELSFHLEMRVRRLMAEGLDEAAARAHAAERFGSVEAARRACLDIGRERRRRERRANRMDDVRRDVLYALRALRRQPAFTAVVLLTLALGIGANGAVFTLFDALLLRTLPVPHPEQLVAVGDLTRVNSVSTGLPRVDLFSVPLYEDLRADGRLVTGLAASGRTGRLDVQIPDEGDVAADAALERASGRMVSANYFDVLGVKPALGRVFAPDEDLRAAGAPVIVLGHAYWQRRFAGARSVLGRSVVLNGTPFTVVGVMGDGFTGEVVGQRTDVWIPLAMQPTVMRNEPWLEDRHVSWLLLLGRLAPSVSVEAAGAGFERLVYRSLDAAEPPPAGFEPGTRGPRTAVPVSSGSRGFSWTRSTYAEALRTLMAAVVLVLLVVCANVANLLLARGAARGREISVRMSLGAGRARVLRQLLTESVLLAGLGAVLGCALATWGSRALLRLASPGPDPIPLDVGLDIRVVAFTAALTLLTALFFGFAPALQSTRLDLAAALRTGGRGTTGGQPVRHGRRRWLAPGRLLVMLQVALSLLLLVGTGMLVRSTERLLEDDVGVARDGLLMVEVDDAPAGLDDARTAVLLAELVERVRRVPGVADVSLSENGIFSGSESGTSVRVEGFEARTADDSSAAYDRVGADYFRAVGARMIAGRGVTDRDGRNAARVVVINRAMADRHFAGRDPIGLRIFIDDEVVVEADEADDAEVAFAVIGVVDDIKHHTLRAGDGPRFYLPLLQTIDLPPRIKLEVRTEREPSALADAVRRAVQDAHPAIRVLNVDPLAELMRESISQDRLVARVISFFGTLALGLAALGLYGVMSYASVRRSGEFGLRIALGARPRTVSAMVLRESIGLVAGGIVLGIPLSIAAVRLIRNQLFGVGAIDLPSIVLALAVLGVTALLAGYLPAARAARVGPLVAMRSE